MKFTTPALIVALATATAAAGQELKAVTSAQMEMVVSAHFLATEAGEKVLAAGGSAIDAMIAVQTVLGLVEPQSSGIAGGAFVVYYDAELDRLYVQTLRDVACCSSGIWILL